MSVPCSIQTSRLSLCRHVSRMCDLELVDPSSKPTTTPRSQDQLRTTVDHLGTGQDRLRTGQGTHEELIEKLLSKEGGR